jgi:hypothetical protein
MQLSAQIPTPWLTLADSTFTGATPVPEGVAFRFDLGQRRENWTHARWSVHELPAPADLSAFQGLLLELRTDAPRRDVGVTVALRERDGTWYSHPWAVHLAAASGENRGLVHFANFGLPAYHNPPNGRFSDTNDRFDRDAITAVAIGVVNSLGVGDVAFTLTRLDTVQLPPAAETPARVSVSGEYLDINGTRTVPPALFGGFHLGPKHHERYRLAANRAIHHDGVSGSPQLGTDATPIVINTIGDRVRPSPRLTQADWETRSAALGRSMGKAAREAGKHLVVEYWNEPYLNWANFNRANFIPRFYDESRAEEGGPVHILHDGSVAPHLFWTRDRAHLRSFMLGPAERQFPHLDHWRRGRLPDGRALSSSALPYRSMEFYYGGTWEPASHPPKDVPDGATYEYKGQTLTAFTPWHVVDRTQFTYWSGKGMLTFYTEPLLAFAKALKEENPGAFVVVGWGNRPGEDHWAGFFQLYQPVIDASIAWIDAYNDHDYGGHPHNMAAQYEVMTAYGMTRHNKWLYAYNTETGANTDPQVYRDQASVSAHLDKFNWVTRKMMHALTHVPDKAKVFLHFGDGAATGAAGTWWSDKGEGVCMDMLLELRGRLLHTERSHDDLYAVASIDGSDPLAPRPASLGDGKVFVVALFNDRQESRKLSLQLQAPAGAELGRGRVRYTRVENGDILVQEEELDPNNNGLETDIVLGPRELRVYRFPITNAAQWNPPEPERLRRQFFTHDLLRDVTSETPLRETLTIPQTLLDAAIAAEVRIVARRLGHGDAQLRINGQVIDVPGILPAENNDQLAVLPIDPAWLKAENQIELSLRNPERAGFFLGNLSLMLEHRPPQPPAAP